VSQTTRAKIITDPEVDRAALKSDRLAAAIALVALGLGLAAAVFYYRSGLTLTHWDAKAHLVVARRILDSLTPGWEQVGAIWLPLPHLLNMLPVQIDSFYRTGASAVAISVVSFAVAAGAAARLTIAATGSRVAALVATLPVALNANILYLQATPMTEPLLLGLLLLQCALLYEWVERDGARGSVVLGSVMAASVLTRYEAWPVTAAALAAAWYVLWRRRNAIHASRRVAVLALFPTVAVLIFLVNSRLTVGQWLVTGGFFVPDPATAGRPLAAAEQVLEGLDRVAGTLLKRIGIAAGAVVLVAAVASLRRSALLIALSLGAAAALPWYAFFEGHPLRIRYMIPLIPALALWAGLAVGLAGRWRAVLAVPLMAGVIITAQPFDPRAPMVREAQWDLERIEARRSVTERLSGPERGGLILISMGSLAHYMQELSLEGFAIRDFIHEGNGTLWAESMTEPQRHAEWILLSEGATQRDALTKRLLEDASFLGAFDRVAESGGVTLFRRKAPQQSHEPVGEPQDDGKPEE
jgi:hypothetical protein